VVGGIAEGGRYGLVLPAIEGGRDASDDPVPLECSIEWLTCTIAGRLVAVMVHWPPSAQDRLPAGAPGTRPGRPVFRDDLAKDAGLLVLRHENALP
jgi:hypothetical protein